MSSNKAPVKKTKFEQQPNLHAYLRPANPGAKSLLGGDTSKILVSRGRGNVDKNAEGIVQEKESPGEGPAAAGNLNEVPAVDGQTATAEAESPPGLRQEEEEEEEREERDEDPQLDENGQLTTKKRKTYKGQSSKGGASDGAWKQKEKRVINFPCLIQKGFAFEELSAIEEEEGNPPGGYPSLRPLKCPIPLVVLLPITLATNGA